MYTKAAKKAYSTQETILYIAFWFPAWQKASKELSGLGLTLDVPYKVLERASRKRNRQDYYTDAHLHPSHIATPAAGLLADPQPLERDEPSNWIYHAAVSQARMKVPV